MPGDEECPRCGALRSSDAQTEPCQGCLLNNALIHTSIGDYEIIDELARGGMGVIYCAIQRATGRVIALKVIQSGELASAEERQRFYAEIKAARRLEHPHIVAVEDAGVHAGRLYYTMKLYPRVLADELDRFRDPVLAARLVATVADAVHHGHVRGVLHRDLKPANILLDEHGDPHVTDFGTAMCRGEPRLTATGTAVGTPMYMAPEQAAGRKQDITTSVDIYSLGVILCELLTGALPFDDADARDDESILRALLDKNWRPTFPRARWRSVPEALKTICVKCLDKNRKMRYGSAEELAKELHRFLRGEPIVARPDGVAARLWRFAQDHRLGVGAGTAMTLLLGGVASAAMVVARTQEAELRLETLESNKYSASSQANSVLLLLRDLTAPLTENLIGNEVVELLPRAGEPLASCQSLEDGPLPDLPAEQRFAELARRAEDEYRKQHPSSRIAGGLRAYDSITLFDRCGRVVAFHGPGGRRNLKRDYSWRDYYKRLQELVEHGKTGPRKAHFFRAFRAEYDGHYKFPIVLPVHEGAQWIGMVMAAISPQSAWDGAPMPGRHDRNHVEILMAPHDRERRSPVRSPPYVVVRHDPDRSLDDVDFDPPGLHPFQAGPVEPLKDPDFRDPVAGFEGRWLAGLAPVGDTGFVEVVATRYDAATSSDLRLSLRLVWLVTAIILASTTLLGSALWSSSRWRRASRRDTVPRAKATRRIDQPVRP